MITRFNLIKLIIIVKGGVKEKVQLKTKIAT